MGEIKERKWDTEHFGIKIGEYIPDRYDIIKTDIRKAKNKGYALLITRVPSEDIKMINALENNAFELKDTIVFYRIDLNKIEYFSLTSEFSIRDATVEDIPAVREIAKRTFKDYIGHFHKDERLEKDKCDELYESWAENSIRDKNVADIALIAEKDHRILGFGTIKIISEHESQAVLFGTAPEAQGRGVFTTLVKEAINRSKRLGLKEFIYGTQLNNYIVQNILTKLGGEIFRSFYTLHCWIDSKEVGYKWKKQEREN